MFVHLHFPREAFPRGRQLSSLSLRKKNSVLKINHKERLAAINYRRAVARTDQISWPFHFRQSLTVVERLFWQLGTRFSGRFKEVAVSGSSNGILYKRTYKMDHDR